MRKACEYSIIIQFLPVLVSGFLRDYIGLTGRVVILSIAMVASIPALFGVYHTMVPEHGKLMMLMGVMATPLLYFSEIVLLESQLFKIVFIFYLMVYLTVGVRFLRKPGPWLGSAEGP